MVTVEWPKPPINLFHSEGDGHKVSQPKPTALIYHSLWPVVWGWAVMWEWAVMWGWAVERETTEFFSHTMHKAGTKNAIGNPKSGGKTLPRSWCSACVWTWGAWLYGRRPPGPPSSSSHRRCVRPQTARSDSPHPYSGPAPDRRDHHTTLLSCPAAVAALLSTMAPGETTMMVRVRNDIAGVVVVICSHYYVNKRTDMDSKLHYSSLL